MRSWTWSLCFNEMRSQFLEAEVSVFCMWKGHDGDGYGQRMLDRLYCPRKATPVHVLSHTLFLKGDVDTPLLKGGIYVPSTSTWKVFAALVEVIPCDVIKCNVVPTFPPKDACLFNPVTMWRGIPGHVRMPYVGAKVSSHSQAPS